MKKDKQLTPEDFAKKYQKLCEETGFMIVVSPVWIKRDDGTFSTKLEYTINKSSKK